MAEIDKGLPNVKRPDEEVAEEIDVTEILKEFKITNTEEGLVVLNPPVVMASGLSDLMEDLSALVTSDDTVESP